MIYLDHFGLREAPFALTPDTAFFYAHGGAQAALNTLLVALDSGEGFVKITGEVGCGKTVLCRELLQRLQQQDDWLTAYVPNPRMTPRELLTALCEELEVPGGAHSAGETLRRLQTALLAQALAGRRVLVCIDEAQAIPMQTLETLRLLSNLETEKRKLLQIVLFGQPELDARLARPEIRQFRQRIGFSDTVPPIAHRDIPAYLTHRLKVAGRADAHSLFEARAVFDLAAASGGVPRLVNQLAHKSLMLAYGQGLARVTRAHVSLARDDSPALDAPTLRQRLRLLALRGGFA